jgi:hypothetical protein
MQKGSCLHGSIGFEVKGELPKPDACHCGKCRKHSGHYFASTDVPRSAVSIRGEDKIAWYQSSEKARRGFCSACGLSLFWDPLFRDWIGLAMHIFVADKGDYDQIADGLPQNRQ